MMSEAAWLMGGAGEQEPEAATELRGCTREHGRAGAAVDVELSKRCFQATRTVKFAKMANKFHSASA